MKRIVLLALTPTLLAQEDVLHLHSGDAFKGKIEKIEPMRVRFKVIMDGPRGRGESIRQIPRNDIAFIDFAQTENESATPRRLWDRHKANLAIANSPAGEYGIKLVTQLLQDKEPSKARRALAIIEDISASDWDDERRQRAQRLRLQALIFTGRASEAKDAAIKILGQSEDPELVVEARQVLGHAAFDALRTLVEKHPRWMDDDEIRPQREALFHEAIDHFLYGSLFQGSLREPAARGLWQVCEIYRHAKMPAKAQPAAEDLIQLYPRSPESELAQTYLEESHL
jgi:hypothetical protein